MDIAHDPRSGLRWIDIPREFQPVFSSLGPDPIIHWMGHAKLYFKGWTPMDAVVIISHSSIYNMRPDGNLVNYLHVKHIDQLVVDEGKPTWVIVKVKDGLGMCDMLFDTMKHGERDVIYDMLNTMSEAQVGVKLRRTRLVEGALLKDAVRLEVPAGYVPGSERFQSRRAVARHYGLGEVFDGEHAREVSEHERRLVVEEFEKIKDELRNELATYGSDQLEEVSRQVDMYIEMLEDRDREIDRLRNLRDTIYDNPQIWDSCPNCETRSRSSSSKITSKTINSLERQVADAEHLLDHLQHARQATSTGKRSAQFSESTQLIQLKQQKLAVNDKIKELRNIIIESPGMYPSNEARRGALSRVGPIPKDATERERQLARHAHDLDRTLADKDKELRMTKGVMRDSFQRQVEELERLKKAFEEYDREIVSYLERVFNGAAYPPGATDHQTPRQLAELTASAARAAATPITIPESPMDPALVSDHPLPASLTSTYHQDPLESRSPRRAWLGSNLQPLSERSSKGPQNSRRSIL
eukprot:TRINITY_DN38737_c0_g1_i1.p1 TRINITY_DN38737_c0_g1~~TRINITY_DN38737_c0_g1_i1.p1  ORF type:complete len:540 (+),score=109.64 TRINITY_DN38737_c0_g1_i1:41-1621(+)